MEEARCRAHFLALFTPMLTIEGNVPRLRARSAHFVSHLPFTLQLRRKVPTQQDILAPSFKVAVSLTEDEALALAAELLSVVASRRGFQPESGSCPLLILVAKSKMMLILSLNSLNYKRENRLRHQYHSWCLL